MTLVYLTCVMLGWTASTGPVTHYDLYKDGTYWVTTTIPQKQVCFYDYDEHNIYVIGLNAAEEQSIPSLPLTIAQVWDFDYDDDEVVGFVDFGYFAYDFGTAASRSDADGDGVVGFIDFGKFVARFGECNNDKYVVPCG